MSGAPPDPRRRQGRLAVALALAVLVAAAGCAGPVRSDGVYASKAARAAAAAASAVETAQLAVQEATAGRLFGRSTAQTLAEAASDAGDVAQLPSLARTLPRLGDQLRQFQKAHQ
jgi:hypothetical protein